MKKFFLSLAAVCVVAGSAFAQAYKGEQYLVNKFGDNWFIQAGAGVQTWDRVAKGDAKYHFRNKINGDVELGFGKYITPVFGARLMVQGGYPMKGYNTLAGYNTTAETVYADKGAEFEFKYAFVHMDGLINLSNWIGGYREDRAYNAVGVIGFGYARSQSLGNKNQDNEFAATLGLLNAFRLSPAFDFNIELKSMLVRQNFSGDGSNGVVGAIPSITAGFTYKIKPRGFITNAAAIAAALAAVDYSAYTNRISDLEDELAASQARANKLAEELANAPKGGQTVINNTAAGPVAVFFTIGKANISKKDKINLQYVAEAIKANPEKSYNVYGYADKETGSEAFNQKLSDKRAENVAKELVKLGVSEKQLNAKGMGCTNNPFEGTLNRVVIVQ